jgi:hypothetical protein
LSGLGQTDRVRFIYLSLAMLKATLAAAGSAAIGFLAATAPSVSASKVKHKCTRWAGLGATCVVRATLCKNNWTLPLSVDCAKKWRRVSLGARCGARSIAASRCARVTPVLKSD